MMNEFKEFENKEMLVVTADVKDVFHRALLLKAKDEISQEQLNKFLEKQVSEITNGKGHFAKLSNDGKLQIKFYSSKLTDAQSLIEYFKKENVSFRVNIIVKKGERAWKHLE